jgi:Retrotransposon gag protein
VPPPLGGKLGGNAPNPFLGDQEKSKKFLLEFQLYRGMNPDVAQLANPYRRVFTFLSYITGTTTLDWAEEQMNWLDDQLAGGVLPTAEQLWTTVVTRFRQNYTDTAERTKSQQQLKELRMQKDGLDAYIAAFAALARKAGYGIDDEATLDMFQQGLPNPLYLNCVKFHHPHTWDEWTD